jgi:hypothetical protein
MLLILLDIRLYPVELYQDRVLTNVLVFARSFCFTGFGAIFFCCRSCEARPHGFHYAENSRFEEEDVNDPLINEYVESCDEAGDFVYNTLSPQQENFVKYGHVFNNCLLENEKKIEQHNIRFLLGAQSEVLLTNIVCTYPNYGIELAWAGVELGQMLESLDSEDNSDGEEMDEIMQVQQEKIYEVRSKEKKELYYQHEIDMDPHEKESFKSQGTLVLEQIRSRYLYREYIERLMGFLKHGQIVPINYYNREVSSLETNILNGLKKDGFGRPKRQARINIRRRNGDVKTTRIEKYNLLVDIEIDCDRKIEASVPLVRDNYKSYSETSLYYNFPFMNWIRWLRFYKSSLFVIRLGLYFSFLCVGFWIFVFLTFPVGVIYCWASLLFESYKFIWRFESEQDLGRLDWYDKTATDGSFDDLAEHKVTIDVYRQLDFSTDEYAQRQSYVKKWVAFESSKYVNVFTFLPLKVKVSVIQSYLPDEFRKNRNYSTFKYHMLLSYREERLQDRGYYQISPESQKVYRDLNNLDAVLTKEIIKEEKNIFRKWFIRYLLKIEEDLRLRKWVEEFERKRKVKKSFFLNLKKKEDAK